MEIKCIEDIQKFLLDLDEEIKRLQREKRRIMKKLKNNNVRLQIVKRKNLLEVEQGKCTIEI